MAKRVTIKKKKPVAAEGKAKEMKSQHECTGGTVCQVAMQAAKIVSVFPSQNSIFKEFILLDC